MKINHLNSKFKFALLSLVAFQAKNAFCSEQGKFTKKDIENLFTQENQYEINEKSECETKSAIESVNSQSFNDVNTEDFYDSTIEFLNQINNKNTSKTITLEDSVLSTHSEIREVIDDLNHTSFNSIYNQFPNRLLLHGPQGNGKLTCAKAIAEKTNSVFIGDEYIISNTKGIQKLFDDAFFQNAYTGKRVVIFLNNIDKLASKNVDNDRVIKILHSILDKIEKKSEFFLIFSANDINNLDTGIISKISPNIIEIDNPDESNRKKIINFYIQKIGLHNNAIKFEEKIINELAKNTAGLSTLCIKQLLYLIDKKNIYDLESLLKIVDQIKNQNPLYKKLPRSKDITKKQDAFTDFILQSQPEINSIVDKINNLSPKEKENRCFLNRIILYGPTGNGKSTLAAAIANKTDSSLIHINTQTVVNKYQGSGAAKIKETFDETIKECEKNPTKKFTILMDEIDGIAHKDETNNDRVSAKKCLWQYLDDIQNKYNIYVVAATNIYGKLDKTFLGRFGSNRLEIKNPSDELREKIIKLYIDKLNNDLKSEGKGQQFSLSIDEIKFILDGSKSFGIRSIKYVIYDIYNIGKNKINEIIETYKKFPENKPEDNVVIKFFKDINRKGLEIAQGINIYFEAGKNIKAVFFPSKL